MSMSKTYDQIYSQVDTFVRQYGYDYIDGVTIELEEFLNARSENGEIKSFQILFDNNTDHYTISVEMSEFTYSNANRIFKNLVQFISYMGINISACMRKEESVHYIFASMSISGLAYCCEIDFS